MLTAFEWQRPTRAFFFLRIPNDQSGLRSWGNKKSDYAAL